MDTNYAAKEFNFSRSMFDVLLTNLTRSHMKMHLYRIMYIGEHDLEFQFIQNLFEQETKKANLDNRDEVLYGFYLHYSKYYILILEGSEEAIFRHATFLTRGEYSVKYSLGAAKVLIMLRVNQRMLRSAWQSLQMSDSTMATLANEQTTSDGTEELQVWQQARVCVAKIHRLASVIASREASEQEGPLTDRSMLPEPWILSKLLKEPLLLSVENFLCRAVSPPPALRHDDHAWPPDDL